MNERTTAGWLQAFLDRRGLGSASGRALFEYRVTTAEFEELRRFLTQRFPRTSHDAATFCLYAAEWWRRFGQGFKWEGLLESLDLDAQYIDLYDPVELGLKFWKRKLRIGQACSGNERTWRDFVGTLSREGGLPLQLLHGSPNPVNRFFKRLLNDRYASGIMSTEAAESVAYILPEAWRHRDIYDLAARLVTAVWELRETVKHATDPIAELDRIQPKWKETLPVVVDSGVATLLVNGLVQQAHKIATAGRPALRVDTRLVRRGDRWSLERSVDPPRKMTPAQVNRMLGLAASAVPPRRLRIVLEDGGTPLPLAVITQWAANDPYDVEFLAPTPLAVGAMDVRVHAETRDEALGGTLLRGGEALDPVPWVFEAQDETATDTDEWTLVGQGSARIRASTALIAVPQDAQIDSGEPAEIEDLGSLQIGGSCCRLLRLNSGRLRLHASGEIFEVDVAAANEDASSYRFSGATLDGLGASDIWRGVPSLIAESNSGLRRTIPPADLQWRPLGVGREWERMSAGCVGSVDLRYAPAGITRFRKSARVVPKATRIELTRRAGADLGGLRLIGTDAERADILATEGFAARADDGGDAFEWTVETLTDPPAYVEIELSWPETRAVRIRAPYPVVGVRFLDHDGRSLPPGATVSFENIGRCRVEAIVPASEDAPVVSVELRAAYDRSPSFVSESQCGRKLRDRSGGALTVVKRFSLDLHELADDIRLRIASSAEMNAHTKLKITSKAAGESSLCVRRFGISMRLNDERDAIVLLHDKSETYVSDIVSRMQLRYVPVSTPDAAPVALGRRSDAEWNLDRPTGDESTWLIVGYDGEVCCARPVIWSPVQPDFDDDPEPSFQPPTLKAATDIRPTAIREAALLSLLERMQAVPSHPEWDQVLPYVHTLKTLPATTFDLLDAMVQVPASCVFALLAGQPELSFQQLWTGFEDLSFSWDTVPVRDWIRGTQIWWNRASRSFDSLDESVAPFVRESQLHMVRDSADQILRRMPIFALVRELVDEQVFGTTSAENSTKAIAATPPGRSYFHGQREQALMDLLRAEAAHDRKWPLMDGIRSLKNVLAGVLPDYLANVHRFSGIVNSWQLSVVMAPVLAALASAWGVRLSPEQIFAIRQLRTFDVNWFQRCHQYTLAMAVGLILEKNPEQYS